MSEKLEAFRAALEALCIEHGVRLTLEREDWDYAYDLCVGEAYEGRPAGLYLDDDALQFRPAPTPEELEQRRIADESFRERMAAEELRRKEAFDVWCRERLAQTEASPQYQDWAAAAEAHGRITRKQQMRVSTDPADPAYIDARPRKAWCNDVLIEGWTVADEFRRVVITPDKVHHGSVLVERLPAEWKPRFLRTPELDSDGMAAWHDTATNCVWMAPIGEDQNAPKAPAPAVDAGFTGMFVHVPDAKPAAAPEPAPAPATKPAKRRR